MFSGFSATGKSSTLPFLWRWWHLVLLVFLLHPWPFLSLLPGFLFSFQPLNVGLSYDSVFCQLLFLTDTFFLRNPPNSYDFKCYLYTDGFSNLYLQKEFLHGPLVSYSHYLLHISMQMSNSSLTYLNHIEFYSLIPKAAPTLDLPILVSITALLLCAQPKF